MADSDTPTPMTDADVAPPAATDALDAAAPLKDAAGEPAAGGSATGDSATGKATQAVRDNVAGLRDQAGDKVRQFADTGKGKAGDLLDQLAQMLTDAAGQVDQKLGAQYGDHARTAASSVQGFAQSVRDKDVDDFAEDVRGFVKQSPAAALGIAAALGFALARVVHSGFDQRS